MKAVGVFPERRTVELVSFDDPKITSPGQVKIRVLQVGVCGTDREICDFEYGTPPEGSEYLVLGHESLGEVVDAGGSNAFKAGDLVVPSVRRPCNHADCVACRAGRQDFCYSGDFRERGIRSQHGFMTQFVVEAAEYLSLVPPELRDVGILVEPLTIAEKTLMEIQTIQQRLPWGLSTDSSVPPRGCHRALVLGAGPVGLLGAMALVNGGYDTYVYSRSRTPNIKADLAESFGAKYFSSQEMTVAQLAAKMGNIDVVYEALGASQLAFEVAQVLGANGIFVFTGVPKHGDPITIDTDMLMRNMVLKNQVILGTVNAGHNAFEAAIRDLKTFNGRWPKALRALITGRYPIEAFREPIFARSGIKNVIEMDGK